MNETKRRLKTFRPTDAQWPPPASHDSRIVPRRSFKDKFRKTYQPQYHLMWESCDELQALAALAAVTGWSGLMPNTQDLPRFVELCGQVRFSFAVIRHTRTSHALLQAYGCYDPFILNKKKCKRCGHVCTQKQKSQTC